MTKALLTGLTLALSISLFAVEFDIYPEYNPNIGEVSTQIKGIVENRVKVGDRVKKGQVLFEFKNGRFNIEKGFTKQHLKIQSAILKQADNLVKKGAISYKDYQECVRDYYSAKYNYEMYKIYAELRKFTAPFDGTIVRIIRCTGSGIRENDPQILVSSENVTDQDLNYKSVICPRWPSVIELKVKLGDQLKAGDVIFSANRKPYENKLKVLENELAFSTRELNRLKQLRKTNSVSLREYLVALDNYNRVLANKKIAKMELEECEVKAPYPCKITKVYRYTGSGVDEEAPIVEIAPIKDKPSTNSDQ